MEAVEGGRWLQDHVNLPVTLSNLGLCHGTDSFNLSHQTSLKRERRQSRMEEGSNPLCNFFLCFINRNEIRKGEMLTAV